MESIQKYLTQYAVYVEDLRRRFLFLSKAFLLLLASGFFLASPFIKLLTTKLAIKDVVIVATSPFQLVNLSMSIGIFFASVIMTPVFVYNLYAFLQPGLLPKEKKLFISLIPLSIIFFFIGFTYGFAILYFTVETIAYLNTTLGVLNYWDVTKFISEIVLTASLLGIVFEFPIIITFLIRIGVTSVRFLRSKRRHAIVLMLLLVSLLPPTDGLSLILMASPMMLIYELTILVNSRFKNPRSLIIK